MEDSSVVARKNSEVLELDEEKIKQILKAPVQEMQILKLLQADPKLRSMFSDVVETPTEEEEIADEAV